MSKQQTAVNWEIDPDEDPYEPQMTQAEWNEIHAVAPPIRLAEPSDYLSDSAQEIGLARIFEDMEADHFDWLDRNGGMG